MTKHEKINIAIVELRNGKEIKMYFHEFCWFIMEIERYKITFDLNFNTKIIGNEITLTGIK